MEYKELKFRVYQAATSNEALLSFEKWLYSGELEFTDLDDLVYDLFVFPYRQKDALREFKRIISSHLEKEEFNYFFAKNTLQKITGPSADIEKLVQVLNSFLDWDYNGDISQFSYNIYYFEDYGYDCNQIYKLKLEVVKEAIIILEKMNEFESAGKFRLDQFENLD